METDVLLATCDRVNIALDSDHLAGEMKRSG